MSEENKDSSKVDTKPIQGGSSQGIQNMAYSDAESIINQNPPHYNQINSSVQPSNIAPMSVLPGQVHQAQLLTQQPYTMYVTTRSNYSSEWLTK